MDNETRQILNEIQQSVANLEIKTSESINKLEIKISESVANLEIKMLERFSEQDAKIADICNDITKMQGHLEGTRFAWSAIHKIGITSIALVALIFSIFQPFSGCGLVLKEPQATVEQTTTKTKEPQPIVKEEQTKVETEETTTKNENIINRP